MWSRGTWRNTSRLTAEMIGMIITASTTPALNIVCVKDDPPGVANSGIQPRWSASHVLSPTMCGTR